MAVAEWSRSPCHTKPDRARPAERPRICPKATLVSGRSAPPQIANALAPQIKSRDHQNRSVIVLVFHWASNSIMSMRPILCFHGDGRLFPLHVYAGRHSGPTGIHKVIELASSSVCQKSIAGSARLTCQRRPRTMALEYWIPRRELSAA